MFCSSESEQATNLSLALRSRPCSVAMWVGLDALVDDTPARMMVRTSEAVMLSHRVDEDRLLLIHANPNANLGSLRSALQDAAGRIIDLA